MSRHPPHLPQETDHAVTEVQVTPGQIERLMRDVETKAAGSDNAGGRAQTAPQFMRSQQESIHAHFDVPRPVYRQRRRRTTPSNKPKC
ncbi:hypothetical protein E2C01_056649 [Portunus trituberculatus]|uniref:Uncharacterized protein n=1 Tax=Portunus trituberculatus TaxID=210409 RepID=A0A5B7GUQ0_PORTR|nr:hypothetical protein [Portunus trituberculatus]